MFVTRHFRNKHVCSSLSCSQVRKLIDTHGPDDLPEHIVLCVEEHLSECFECASIVDATRSVSQQLKGLQSVEVGDDFCKALKARILRAGPMLDEEEESISSFPGFLPSAPRPLMVSAACLVVLLALLYKPVTRVEERRVDTAAGVTSEEAPLLQQVSDDNTLPRIEMNAKMVEDLQPGESPEAALSRMQRSAVLNRVPTRGDLQQVKYSSR